MTFMPSGMKMEQDNARICGRFFFCNNDGYGHEPE